MPCSLFRWQPPPLPYLSLIFSHLLSLVSLVLMSIFFYRHLNLFSLRTFSCLCYPHLGADTTNKLESCSKQYVFVGYNLHFKCYRCLDLETNHIHISHHLTLDETNFLLGCIATPATMSTMSFSWNQVRPCLSRPLLHLLLLDPCCSPPLEVL